MSNPARSQCAALPPWYRSLRALAVAVLALCALSYWAHTITISFDLPWGDHWRWIRFGLLPLQTGDISFFEYLTSEYVAFSHSHIVTLLQLWLNKTFLGLNYRLEMAVGSFALLSLVVVIACSKKYGALRDPRDGPAGLLVLLAATLVMLGLHNVNAWTLIQFESVYILVAYGFFLYADTHYTTLHSRAGYFVWVFALFFLGDVPGVMAVLSVLLYMILFDFKRHRKTLLLSVLCLAAAYLVARFLLPPSLVKGGSVSRGLTYLFTHIDEGLVLLLKAGAQSLVDRTSLSLVFGPAWERVQYGIGLLVWVFIGSAFLLYCKTSSLRAYRLPLLLIILTGLTVGGLLVLRLADYGPGIGQSDRYTKVLQAGVIGSSLIFILRFGLSRGEDRSRNYLPALGIAAMLAVLALFNVTAQVHHWRYYPAIAGIKQQSIHAILLAGQDPAKEIVFPDRRCAGGFCKPSIAYLKRHKLSVFRSRAGFLPLDPPQ